MEEKFAIAGILVIVLISVLSVVYLDSATGGATAYGGYGASKLYGGMLKKTYQQPNVLGREIERDIYLRKAQLYLYENQDKWDCSYGAEAETSPYPCVADENNPGKYCCVIPEDLPDRYAQWAPRS
jgi:hypothetical protein